MFCKTINFPSKIFNQLTEMIIKTAEISRVKDDYIKELISQGRSESEYLWSGRS